jgi:ornithine cyclodeaminase/alanine dehydrogenase-like protein (mu-crystallin family)
MHLTVFPNVKSILVYDIVKASAKKLARELKEYYGIDVSIADEASKVVKDSDILITATTSRTPVIDGRFLKDGAHVVSIGYIDKDSRELDDETFRRASKIYVDSKDAIYSGDIRIPLEKGVFSKDKVIGELSQVILGKIPGREKDDEVTVFKSVGTAVLDAAMAYKIYLQAKERGIENYIEL